MLKYEEAMASFRTMKPIEILDLISKKVPVYSECQIEILLNAIYGK